jgi:hypothetical protein
VDAASEIYGDVANVAARVQALAEPGAVVVTARVQRQVTGLFVAEERGSHELKGVPEPVTLYRIVRASGGGRRAGQSPLHPVTEWGRQCFGGATRSPTTTNPVAIPTRVCSGAPDFSPPTAAINSSPARTARSASSS